MAVKIIWDEYESGWCADHIHESDKSIFSKLLGPDGQPLKYEQRKIGFDLRIKQNENSKRTY